MKKNRMMRLASGLLVAVLLTTCAISGTFAKYVTRDSANDSARVAKFGVVIQADGSLFGAQYKTATDNSAITWTAADAGTVNGGDADQNVVAPGTKNEKGIAFSVTGTPEVETKLDATIVSQNVYLTAGTYGVMVNAPTVTETSWKADTYYTYDSVANEYRLSTFFSDAAHYFTLNDMATVANDYYPVVYSAPNDNDGTISTDSLNEIAATYAEALNGAAVAATVEGYRSTYTITEKIYDPHFNYAGLTVDGEILTWEWAFENVGMDGADTILGDLAAGVNVVKLDTTNDVYKAPVAATTSAKGDYHLTTGISISITVTQVD